jgi:hypothetical protein
VAVGFDDRLKGTEHAGQMAADPVGFVSPGGLRDLMKIIEDPAPASPHDERLRELWRTRRSWRAWADAR